LPYQIREEIAHLRAILEFAQSEQPARQLVKRLDGWLPTGPEELARVRTRLKEGLQRLFAERTEDDAAPFWQIGPLGGISIAIERTGVTGFITHSQDALLLRTIEALRNNMVSVRKCSRRGCGLLFVPNKRQKYCSPRCSQNARFERFRSKLTPKRWRELRH
jgi:hypothetical protein